MPAGPRPLQTFYIFLLVECIWKKDGYKSCATHTEMQLHQTWLLILCHTQICLLVQCDSIKIHTGFIYSDMCICKLLLDQARHLAVAKSSDMPTGRVPLPKVCKSITGMLQYKCQLFKNQ